MFIFFSFFLFSFSLFSLSLSLFLSLLPLSPSSLSLSPSFSLFQFLFWTFFGPLLFGTFTRIRKKCPDGKGLRDCLEPIFFFSLTSLSFFFLFFLPLVRSLFSMPESLSWSVFQSLKCLSSKYDYNLIFSSRRRESERSVLRKKKKKKKGVGRVRRRMCPVVRSKEFKNVSHIESEKKDIEK